MVATMRICLVLALRPDQIWRLTQIFGHGKSVGESMPSFGLLISMCENAGINGAEGRDKRPLLVFAGEQSLRYRMRAAEELDP
jgi:hypothetical protein